jgi:acetyl-CoA decarbonylase/synthase complex subunit gamma
MSFAVKIGEGVVAVDKCPYIAAEGKATLEELVAPPIRLVKIGVGEAKVSVGGEKVMYRHELRFLTPTALAIKIDDSLSREEVSSKVKQIERLKFERIGEVLKINCIAVRSVSGSREKFAETVAEVMNNTSLPLILCSFDAEVLKAGLLVSESAKPLLYAATEQNLIDVASLAVKHGCPLAVYGEGDLSKTSDLIKKLIERGVNDILLDVQAGSLKKTLENMIMARRVATAKGELRYPLIAFSDASWISETTPSEKVMEEIIYASAYLLRYASIIVLGTSELWALMPLLTLRQAIYTDPVKPTPAKPGLYPLNDPDENSPVFVTSNFILTFHIVSNDIKTGGVKGYLLVLDTGGTDVGTGVYIGAFSAEKIHEFIEKMRVSSKISHKCIIIPGLAARLKATIEDATGWNVMVGPMDSSDIPEFVSRYWPPKK